MSLAARLAMPDLIGQTTEYCLSILNAPNENNPIRVDIATADIANYLSRQQVVRKIRNLANSSEESIQELAESAKFVLDGRWEIVTCSNPDVDTAFKAQLSAFVSVGVISQEQADDINSMADGLQSWAEKELGHPVTAREIDLAR